MSTLEELRAGELAGCTRLNLSCGLREFPREIFDLADTLEILDLSGNELSALPDDLPRLHKLRILFCSSNRFTELPAVLGQCPQLSMVGFKSNQIRHVPAAALPPQLRWLILTDNLIDRLPAELGRCTQLQKLMLAGNQLQVLPPELAACHRLELLRIAANRLTALPDWLPALPRLSWLAYAGNPFCADNEADVMSHADIVPVPWEQLHVQHKLGEGASGVTSHALWQRGQAQEVAVKLFKGTITSDGLPQSEMHACICAGEHANLIAVRGCVADHPAGAHGLVMSLVGAHFRNLAGPPSLDSCTRDVYASEAGFTPDAALRIAHNIASAAAHLHARGIMHGDLYAHNILHDGEGNALLGDFGAASFYVPDAMQADALQRLEVRAYSCLLEELIERCTGHGPILSALMELQARCVRDEGSARPLFAEIEQRLAELMLH